jgi:hypothetical protein
VSHSVPVAAPCTPPGAVIYAAIRESLERRRYDISREITAYPTPIPACDAHINRLLEERGLLSELMELVDAEERRNGREADARSLAAALAAREPLDVGLLRELTSLAGG